MQWTPTVQRRERERRHRLTPTLANTNAGPNRPATTGTNPANTVPSTAPRANQYIVTNETMQMADNQSLATWATTNTMGGQLTGNVPTNYNQAEGTLPWERAVRRRATRP
mmetsp:Transcript_31976/g.54561  ORF Transcript_31976/g.54561 Transcript_31976/m.54561 type:complete len:110 (+) Transcript_31976:412-741(+)